MKDEQDKQDFEKAFQQKFSDWEATPPSDALMRMQAQLRAKKRFLWLRRWAFGLSLLFLLSFGGYLIRSRQSTVDRPQLNADSNSVKNSQKIEKNNPEILSENKIKINSDSNSIKNSQKIDNQLIVKKNPENPVILSENKRKINSDSNSIKNSQKVEKNNPVILSENKDKRPQTTDHSKKIQITGNQLITKENKVKTNVDSIKNSQKIEKNNLGNSEILSKNKRKINSDSIKNSQKIEKNNPENPVILSENNKKINSDSIKNSQKIEKNNPGNSEILSENNKKINSDSIKNLQNSDNQVAKTILDLKSIKPYDSLWLDLSQAKLNFQNLKYDSTKWQKPFYPRWFISLNFAANFTYKSISPYLKDSILIQDFVATRGFAKENLGWQINAQISRKINNRLELYAGLGYAYYKTKMNYQQLTRLPYNFYENVGANQFTLIPQFKTDTISRNYIRQIGQVDIGLSYKIFAQKNAHWLRTSIGMNIDKNWGGFGRVAYQFTPKINQRLQLMIEPYFLYQFQNRKYTDVGFSGQNYHLGLQIGLKYAWR